MRKTIFTCLVALMLVPVSSFAEEAVAGSANRIIPAPAEIVTSEGTFTWPAEGIAATYKGTVSPAFKDYLKTLPLTFAEGEKGKKHPRITFELNERMKNGSGEEGYRLLVTKKEIRLSAATEAGLFYGLQSLLQMTNDGKAKTLDCVTVNDRPRFPYRGLLFDVSRHFRSPEFLMKQMDAMALLKMNRLHLHFTDGAGWRMQIDRYPRLTSFAAWRPQRTWTDWTANGHRYCESSYPAAYGGFYTKDDIRRLLAYARERHITIIPDVEMPGHSDEVLAAYPELSCAGKPYTNSDYCIGKEATFTFLQNVLDEIIDLFPSEYIHIGGDEAAKTGWKDCPDCQRRMKEEGIETLDGLQSYFVHRMEEYINKKGRKMIGFDEIMEGGLSPNATVMSWRGTKGGIEALKSGHHVIMTPVEYCYLDYTQDAPFREPVSIGGYLPLKSVYDYEPLEPGLTEADASRLLGVQGNLWTEYVTTDEHAEYMYYPRAFAIAETGWSKPENKVFDRFRNRAVELVKTLQARGFKPFDLAKEYGERPESFKPVDHLAKGAKVTYGIAYRNQYKAAGDATLTDGILGGWTYRDNRWQGFLSDVDVTLDLGGVKPIHYIGATFMHSRGAWVYLPDDVTISISKDGKSYEKVGVILDDMPSDVDKLMFKTYGLPFTGEARYVRLQASRKAIDGAWLFMDEIVVN